MDGRHADFEYEGEMQADVALDYGLMKELYPFRTRLSGPANILIMPALHSADISAKLLQQLGATVIGPVLIGIGGRCRSSRSVPRSPISSPPPPSPPSTQGGKSDPASRWTNRRWINPAAKANLCDVPHAKREIGRSDPRGRRPAETARHMVFR